MNIKEKREIKSYLLDYLKKKVPNFKKQGKMFQCPACNKMSANIFPVQSNKIHCFEPTCKFKGDIFDVVRLLEYDGEITDEEIATFLKEEFNIQTNDDIEKLLVKYQNWGWDLMPIVKGLKIPYQGENWSNKSCKDLDNWKDWINSELNIALRCGKKSNTTIIDVDFLSQKESDIIQENKDKEQIKEIKERKKKRENIFNQKYKSLFNNTVTQDTKNKGYHYIYSYNKKLPKSSFTTDEGIHFDIETDGGYCLIEPSIVNGLERKIIGDIIEAMNWELEDFLLKNISRKKVERKKEECLIILPKESELSFEKLNGNRNNTFVHLGGLLRKRFSLQDTNYVMRLFNKLLDKQVPEKELQAMMGQIAKYKNTDNTELQKKIWDYLCQHSEATSRDLVLYFKAEEKTIKDILVGLMKENKIYRQRGNYKAVKRGNWKQEFVDYVKIVPYQVPFFNDYNVFREGDMICIGARPGVGKTFISMNIIKKFVEQGVKPYYLGSESRSRFLKIAMELGIKETDFYWDTSYEPENIELEDNAVTVIDWLLPEDFATTAHVYKQFQKQLDKHNGLCFIFSQLKNDDTFYAEGQLIMFASLAVKYFYSENAGIVDNQNTYFHAIKARESKIGRQEFDIMTRFENGILELRK
ncbi:MAG: bifunctional DNA primase/polymerase [Candidatus Helarchaeota archaeon]